MKSTSRKFFASESFDAGFAPFDFVSFFDDIDFDFGFDLISKKRLILNIDFLISKPRLHGENFFNDHKWRDHFGHV